MKKETDLPEEKKQTIESQNVDLILRRKEMSKETWIKNVMRIYPHRTLEETQELWQKLFEADQELNFKG